MQRVYICIDLKSFYASVECVERNLDPLRTHLVVADRSRTEKTICLAVTPPLKELGISGRPRLFEVEQKVRYLNALRKVENGGKKFHASSFDSLEYKKDHSLALDYMIATPRMAYYLQYSRTIYRIYLKYVAPEDIHVYSIDEVFMDATDYIQSLKISPYEFAKKIILDIKNNTNITATAGIGTNLYLAKVAMDIVAKSIKGDRDGVRIAELNERKYREVLWSHTPLTDFWRVGPGYAKRLQRNGIYTMGDIALRSLEEEDFFYKLFGVNGELLIDHAWGVETCTMSDIKTYKAKSNSLGAGQVLQRPYSYEEAKVVVWEMADQLAMDLMSKGYVTRKISLTLSYDKKNLEDPQISSFYKGEIKIDSYGRKKPKSVHGSLNLETYTYSSKKLTQSMVELFDQLVNPKLFVRKISISANQIIPEEEAKEDYQQLSFFSLDKKEEKEFLEREKRLQNSLLSIKAKYGKNSIFKGVNLREGATGRERNQQIGGHRA